MFCSRCGKEIHDEAVVCVYCGCSTKNSKNVSATDDKMSAGLCILAFFIPLFGIIYWPVMHSKAPKRAKACGITAIISWALAFVMLLGMSGL